MSAVRYKRTSNKDREIARDTGTSWHERMSYECREVARYTGYERRAAGVSRLQ